MRNKRLVNYARANRKRMSEAEAFLWSELRRSALGVRFRRQVPIGPYIADFACVWLKIVVEVDGSQHAESPYDIKRDAFMGDQGWTVLRFWAWDVIRDVDMCTEMIASVIEELVG